MIGQSLDAIAVVSLSWGRGIRQSYLLGGGGHSHFLATGDRSDETITLLKITAPTVSLPSSVITSPSPLPSSLTTHCQCNDVNPVKVVVSQSELSRFTFLQRAPFHQEQVKLLAVVDNRYYTSMDLGGGGGGRRKREERGIQGDGEGEGRKERSTKRRLEDERKGDKEEIKDIIIGWVLALARSKFNSN